MAASFSASISALAGGGGGIIRRRLRQKEPMTPSSSSSSSSLLSLRHRRRAAARTTAYRIHAPRPFSSAAASASSADTDDDDASPPPAPKITSVNILYGSQGGTAQLFAMQLGDELDELSDGDGDEHDSDSDSHPLAGLSPCSVSALNDYPPGASSPRERLMRGDDGGIVVNVIVTSCTGAGDPPDNGREFYEWITCSRGGGTGGVPSSQSSQSSPSSPSPSEGDQEKEDQDRERERQVRESVPWSEIRYAVFGCGNSVAHPNNYNAVAKLLDGRLNELGATRVHELGLGDDSDCIEDDFDNWQDSLIQRLSSGEVAVEGALERPSDAATAPSGSIQGEGQPVDAGGALPKPKVESCWHAEDDDTGEEDNQRKDPQKKYPKLKLKRFDDARYDLPRDDLFHIEEEGGTPFYRAGTRPLPVVSNRALGTGGAEYAMRELRLSLEGVLDATYTAGDHLLVYPRNAQCVVDSYLAVLEGVDGSDLVEGVLETAAEKWSAKGGSRGRAYPHPFGITVEETLLHCVDLSQPPSPSFARMMLGRKDVRYKDEIAAMRKTPIELIRASGRSLSLEELLFNLPPMQPRYYSIASSPMVHPCEIFLTFRPVKYLTALGHLREGLCTSFMKQLHPVSVGGGFGADAANAVYAPRVPAVVNSNPSFRLPPDDSTPIVLIAGGCGVAPIRSFLEERMEMYRRGNPSLGEAHVFLGFRSPRDEAYRSAVDKALECGVVTKAHVTYTKSCRKSDRSCTLVTQILEEEENGRTVHDLVASRGGHIYLCGGARLFGAAVERTLQKIFLRHGDMDEEGANEYLRQLIREGRLQEDLAD